MKQPRIILYDLETSPLIVFTWGLWEQNALYTLRDWEILSFSYKIYGQKKVTCVSRPQFKDETDKSITKALWKVLNSADITIAHNGIGFDKKKSNAKFLQYKLNPPIPSRMIDTLTIARKHFKLSSNKLNDLAKVLGVGEKEQTGGFQLWKRCMDGVRDAWRTMVRYNKQDVALLESVYERLLPWIDNHPNLAVLAEKPNACPKCLGEHLQSRGYGYSNDRKYRRFQCTSCKGWVKGRINVKSEKSKYKH